MIYKKRNTLASLLPSLLPLAFLGYACGGSDSSSSSGGLSDFSLTIDTVFVDSGEEFLLSPKLGMSYDFSHDGSEMVYYDYQTRILEIISLKDMRLVSKKQQDGDGPNSLGFFVNFLGPVSDGLYYTTATYQPFRFLNPHTGEVEKQIRSFEESFEKIDWEEKLFFNPAVTFEKNGQVAWSISGKSGSFMPSYLTRMDLQKEELKAIPIEALADYAGFSLSFSTEGSSTARIPGFHILPIQEGVLIGNSIDADMLIYEVAKDTLRKLPVPESRFQMAIQQKPPVTEVESMERFQELSKDIAQNWYLGDFIADEKEKKLYRLARRSKSKQVEEEEAPKNEMEMVLLVFDLENLRLLGEVEIGKVEDYAAGGLFMMEPFIFRLIGTMNWPLFVSGCSK
ncbi:DUF4221 family protein [Nitritalea halalkaliphila]|nr:DUF4221 family protein [Nitritalea halalkaliphila]